MMCRYLYILSITLLVLGCKTNDTQPLKVLYPKNTTHRIISKKVGQDIKIKICESSIESEKVILTGLNAYYEIDHGFHNGCLYIKIDSTKLKIAGEYELSTINTSEIIHLAHITLLPEVSYGKIDSYTGPKSLSYQDRKGSMITSFPVDKYNNATGQSETYTYNVQKGEKQNRTNKVLNNTYPNFIIKKTGESKIILGANTKEANTIEHSIRTLSGCAKNVIIKTENIHPYADGRQFFKVTTKILRDPQGQIIENGTSANLYLTNEDGEIVSAYNSSVINGVVACWIKNPIYDGQYYIQAKVCNQKSNRIAIHYKPIIKEITYAWSTEKNTILVGPLASTTGNLITNGTPISVTFPSAKVKQEIVTSTYNGFATINLNKLWTSDIPNVAAIEIYGKKFRIKQKKV